MYRSPAGVTIVFSLFASPQAYETTAPRDSSVVQPLCRIVVGASAMDGSAWQKYLLFLFAGIVKQDLAGVIEPTMLKP